MSGLFDAATQTGTWPPADKSCGTTEVKHVGCSAGGEDSTDVPSEEALRFDRWSNSPLEAVARSLRTMAPEMIAQIKSSSSSKAYELLRLHTDKGDEDTAVTASLVRSFTQYYESNDTDRADGMLAVDEHVPCASVAWNPTGSMLAVSFGHKQHAGWCRHRSGVVLWNPFRRSAGGSSSGEVDHVFSTSCCVASATFHPDQPSILAAGLQTGEIVVWDVSKTDGGSNTAGAKGPASGDLSVVACSRADDYLHREAVVSLSWSWHPPTRQYLLVSVSQDGKGHAWSLNNKLEHPVSSFVMSTTGRARTVALGVQGRTGTGRRRAGSDSDDDDLPKRRAAGKRAADGEVLTGISSACTPLNGRADGSLVAGGDTGSLLQCSLPIHGLALASAAHPEGSAYRPMHAPGAVQKAENTMPWEQSAAALLLQCPEADRARVCRAVERSARDSRASTVTLGMLYRARPEGRLLFPSHVRFGHNPHSGAVLGVACSPFHRSLFATAGADGRLCVWSSLLAAPILTFEPSVAPTGIIPVNAVAWSRTRPCVLACASADGAVHVYDLWSGTAKAAAVLASPASAGTAIEPGRDAGAAVSLSFNSVQRRCLAVGHASGLTVVWRLPWSLSDPSAHSTADVETDALKAFLRSIMTEETGREEALAQEDGGDGRVNSLGKVLKASGWG